MLSLLLWFHHDNEVHKAISFTCLSGFIDGLCTCSLILASSCVTFFTAYVTFDPREDRMWHAVNKWWKKQSCCYNLALMHCFEEAERTFSLDLDCSQLATNAYSHDIYITVTVGSSKESYGETIIYTPTFTMMQPRTAHAVKFLLSLYAWK